jgi:hypothetical protein
MPKMASMSKFTWNNEVKMTTQEFPVGSDCAVKIESTACDITVTGLDRPQVVIESRSKDECHVVHHEDSLQITADPQRCDHLAVSIPGGCTVTVGSVSGDLSVAQLAGEVAIKSMSGDVVARQITGHLHIHAVSGDVAIMNSSVPDLVIETVSGDISLETELSAEGNYSLHSISGDMHVVLDEGQRCTLRYQSLSGDFTCSLPHELRRQGWGKVEAAINGGGVVIACNSTSGDLAVRPTRSSTQQPIPVQPTSEAKETHPLSESFGLNAGALTVDVPTDVPHTRMEVLKAIENGSLSVAEGLARLQALDK